MASKHVEHTESSIEPTPEGTMERAETMEVLSAAVQQHTEATETALARTAEHEATFSEAIREGASAACEAAASFFPAVGKIIHKGVYNSFYYLTYGAVFGALAAGRLIPSNNAMGEGVRDGFEAAKKAFEEREEPAEAAPMDEGLATA